MEAKIDEIEREKQILSQKYEQQIRELREDMDRVVKFLAKPPHIRLIKPEKMGLNPNVRIKRMLQKVESAPN
jgi:transposase-like protein